jgi:ABC-type branched-subunit amino acid transport system substrate-binding protein
LASQSANLLFRQLKHKVFGEALAVSLNCANKRTGFGSIQSGKIPLDNDVVSSEPRIVEGRYVANAYLNPNREEAARLLTNYRTKFGKDPLYPSVMGRGYDGFMTVADALKRSSDLSSEQIKNALYRVDFEGAGFHVKMSPDGGARLPVVVLQVKDGILAVR